MNPGDLLLRWVSCYRELRRARVQTAAERLLGPPVDLKAEDPRRALYVRKARRLTKNLLRLAHVEEFGGDRLLTVPPTIVSLDGGRHILVGARSETMLERLAAEPGVSLLPPIPQRDGPGAQALAGDESALSSAAEKHEITYLRDRSGEVLASLPRLSDILSAAPQEGIPEQCERWEPGSAKRRPRWRRARSEGYAPGLYRTIRKPHQWYLAPADGGPSVRLDSPERRSAAAWSLVQEKRLGYCSRTRELTLPAINFGLPLLVDRALILASGRLPEVGEGVWKYFEVDPERAQHITRIVGARLEEDG
jgi:hypothetical protein